MVKYQPLIIGHDEENHITSKQWGAMNAAMLGKGRWLTNYGDKLKATIISSNIVQVETGMIYTQGRFIINENILNLPIEDGVQGYSRYVLICGSYNRDDLSTESDEPLEFGEWIVVEGTPSSSSPIKPIVEVGDIFEDADIDVVPVWSVLITDLTPSSPTLELGGYLTIEELSEKFGEDGALKLESGGTGRKNGTVAKADAADKLTTGRTIRTNLASTTAPTFNGTANVAPGVSGVLPLSHGGTGKTTAADAAAALGVLRPTQLYNSTTGSRSPTLSQTSANFTYLTIEMSDPSGAWFTVMVSSPNGKSFYGTILRVLNGIIVVASARFDISGTKISYVLGEKVAGSSTSAYDCVINRVVGWK